MFAAAIFDMDGLLIDSERIIMAACISAAQELGMMLSETDYITVVGRSRVDVIRILTQLLGGADNFTLAMTRAGQFLGGYEVSYPLKSGALAMLTALQNRGIPCAVASSSAKHEIQYRLQSVGVLDFFATITSGNEVLHGKPNPAIYQLAAERLGFRPEQCMAFEDSENGARAAIAAGLKVVVVPDLKMPGDFVLANSFGVLPSLDDAVHKLDEWFC
ncbi:MAG: HAD family phosphatase [Methylophilaceae bacterium]